MDIKKFNIIAYIKPTDNFKLFAESLKNAQKIKYLNKTYISFVEDLPQIYIKELNKYKNILYKTNINKFWAQEIKDIIDENPNEYYFMWEEDCHIFNISEFEKTYETYIDNEIDYCFTIDLKWIKRAKHLHTNNIAVEKNNFIYFNWGTKYAQFCRNSSPDPLVNGAYPVTVSGIYSHNLLVKLLDDILNSNYWKEITSGNFHHYHNNPKLPHSFEVYPGFWWEGKNNGYGNIEFSAMVSKTQFAEELGERLIKKIN